MCTLSVIAIGRYQDRYKCSQSIMLWNWQLSDWPAFSFDAALLREAEERFLKGAGVVVGSMHHLDGDARQGIVIELISQEMVDSSAIEGEGLGRASVQSSIEIGRASCRERVGQYG